MDTRLKMHRNAAAVVAALLWAGSAVAQTSPAAPAAPAAPASVKVPAANPAPADVPAVQPEEKGATALPVSDAAAKPAVIDYTGEVSGVVTDSSPLVKAILAKNEQAVRDAIAAGAKVSDATTDGSYPIVVAALHSSVEVMKVLTGNGADVQAHDKAGRNALHYAAMTGDAAKVTLLAALNAPVSALDIYGISPLYYALYNKQLAAATALKDNAAADVNQLGADGEMLAFKLVSYKDRPEVAKWMVDAGLQVFKRNKDERTMMDVTKRLKFTQTHDVLVAAYDQMVRSYIEKQKALEEEKKKANE